MLQRLAQLVAGHCSHAASPAGRSIMGAIASSAPGGMTGAWLTSLLHRPILTAAAQPILQQLLQRQQQAVQAQLVRCKYTYAFKKSANTPGLVFWTPRTPGLRHKISIDYKALGVYTGPPIPGLSFRKANTGGRNAHGHITVRGRGGGIKKVVRVVDWTHGLGPHALARPTAKGPALRLLSSSSQQRSTAAAAAGVGATSTPAGSLRLAGGGDGGASPRSAAARQQQHVGVVQRIEHDPNRTGFLALVRYESSDGAGTPLLRYHLAPHGLRVGDTVMAGTSPDLPIQPGNRLLLRHIPLGTPIHNIEMEPGSGGKVARSAGAAAKIQYKEEKFAVVEMPSGEVRRLPLDCAATIGSVSNTLNKLTIMGKAGVNRLRGRRPKVRGIAMNPVDHPHGGRTNGGRPSCTPWGVYCKGQRTRLRNKWTNRYIITRKGGVPIDKFVQAKKWRVAAEAKRKAKSGATAAVARAGPPEHLLGPTAPAWGSAPGAAAALAAMAGRGRAGAGLQHARA